MSLTHERLLELLHYDPQSGVFTRRVRVNSRALAGAVVGCPSKAGYLRVMVDGTSYLLHRLAFFYMTGRFPTGEVDHIDGRRDHNAWTNLRDVPRALNGQNQRRAHRDSVTGLLGVSRNKKGFKASICVDRQIHRLGTYTTPQEAHAVYVRAKRDMHPGSTL